MLRILKASLIAATVSLAPTVSLAEPLTCWYGDDGNFTSSQAGNQIGARTKTGDHCGYSVQACSDPRKPVHMSERGDKSWAYVIARHSPRDDGLGPCLIFLSVVYEMLEQN